jgi:alkylation response protein AidB-like acyl-CoA dehydrogenase
MTLTPSAEAEDLRGHLRKFLATHAGLDRLRHDLESVAGYDGTMWRRAAEEIGLTGMLAPASVGGSAADLLTVGVVFEELGRVLVRAPFLSTIGLATPALLHTMDPNGADADGADADGADRAASLLADIATGIAVSVAWSGDRPSATDIAWDGQRLHGIAPAVIDGADADRVLVAARAIGHGGVVLVDVDPDAVQRTPLPALDTTRRLARLAFDGTPGAVLATDAARGLDRAAAIATLLLGAEQVGGAQRALELSVDYARTRVQFGRPIGSFEAVKHRCADMLVDVELSRSLVYNALVTVDADPAAAEREAALVGGFVGDAYVSVAGSTIQVHGGIGFTWEHDAHLYLKRAKSSQLMFGTPGEHRRRAAALLGIAVEIAP